MIENEIGSSPKSKAVIFFGLLISTGVIAALPFVGSYGHHCGHSPTVICVNNLRQLDGAKQMWALEKKKGTNDVPSMTDIAQYVHLQITPSCPMGGVYSLGRVCENPRCDIKGHELPR